MSGQEPLIVHCFRDDDLNAIVLSGADLFGLLAPAYFIDLAEMPEPDAAGLWAWVDVGSEPIGRDPETGLPDGVTWRGRWRRLTGAEIQCFAAGYKLTRDLEKTG